MFTFFKAFKQHQTIQICMCYILLGIFFVPLLLNVLLLCHNNTNYPYFVKDISI